MHMYKLKETDIFSTCIIQQIRSCHSQWKQDLHNSVPTTTQRAQKERLQRPWCKLLVILLQHQLIKKDAQYALPEKLVFGLVVKHANNGFTAAVFQLLQQPKMDNRNLYPQPFVNIYKTCITDIYNIIFPTHCFV